LAHDRSRGRGEEDEPKEGPACACWVLGARVRVEIVLQLSTDPTKKAFIVKNPNIDQKKHLADADVPNLLYLRSRSGPRSAVLEAFTLLRLAVWSNLITFSK